jgi:hypothetical protein
LWHTHPEASPSPSGQDELTTQKFFEALGENMKGFLLVIIGNKGETPEMAVWLAKAGACETWIKLNETQLLTSSGVQLSE